MKFKSDTFKSTLSGDVLDTPLGKMVCIADEQSLYALEFVTEANLEFQLKKTSTKFQRQIAPGQNNIVSQVIAELDQYFAGKLKSFTVPLIFTGTKFQKETWRSLLNIPYGKTWSYLQLAKSIKRPKAFRAVANANGANKIAVIVPCHRVIRADGGLGGYSAGIDLKERLLNLEANYL